jgi:leucyl aminopeptidase
VELKVSIGQISGLEVDGLIVNIFEGAQKVERAAGTVDRALDGAIADMIEQGEIKGKLNEITVIHTLGKMPARIVLVAGLGKQADFTVDKIRVITALACRTLRRLNCRRVATSVLGGGAGGFEPEIAAQAITEGAILGLYTYRKYISKEPDNKDIEQLIIVDKDADREKRLKQGCHKGKIIAEAANLARDMVNEPANYMTPSDMAKIARNLAEKYKLELTILDREQMEKEGMGALLAVAQGSEQPPKFIMLSYNGNKKAGDTLGFIGKGLTFDSGGISLKPSDSMKDMKGDMSGGAAVMAAVSAVAQLKLKVNVTAVVPATENLPSGKAVKPGDVVRAMNDKTIEVVNTDAEGRMILADALSYAIKHGISPLVDIATLTGACQVALGDVCSGIFTNNQKWVDKVIKAGADAGERHWQLPMYEEYKELNKSDVADIKNSGGRYGGAITAAQFLAEFVNGKPWAHIDIAGTFESDKEQGYTVKGATGVTVRTLVNLAIASAEDK